METSYTLFDRSHSHRLDCVIWLLDHEPHRVIRWLLSCYRAMLESGVR
jgi:hypothetical protein